MRTEEEELRLIQQSADDVEEGTVPDRNPLSVREAWHLLVASWHEVQMIKWRARAMSAETVRTKHHAKLVRRVRRANDARWGSP